jgi:hypothetical protein
VDIDRDLEASLGSCARAIDVVAYPKEEVQHVLGRVLERYQQNHGVEFVDYKGYCDSTRDSFDDLWEHVRLAFTYEEEYTSLC